MGWNGSDRRGAAAPAQPKVTAKKPSPVRGIVAGLVVVLAAVVCYFAFFSKSEKPAAKKPEKKPTVIKEVKPAVVPTNVVETGRKRTGLGKDWRNIQAQKVIDKYGTNMPPDLKSYVHYLKNPPQRSFKPKTPYSFLRHPSERAIVSLLQAKPGDYFLIKPEYGESFNNDFVNALLDKVEIEEGDSDEVKDIKNFVNDAKKEIAALVRAEGRKPSDLMNEHAAALYELGQLQENLSRELQAARDNPDLSDQDVEDLFAAANRMRKKRGLAELPVPNLTKRSVQLQKKQARAAKKAAREAKQNKQETPK